MKKNVYESFFEYSNDIFFEYLANIELRLIKSNKEYKKLVQNEKYILDCNKKLRLILEDNESIKLKEDEVENLLKLLEIRDKRFDILKKEIFYLGINNAYFISKKSNILK